MYSGHTGQVEIYVQLALGRWMLCTMVVLGR